MKTSNLIKEKEKMKIEVGIRLHVLILTYSRIKPGKYRLFLKAAREKDSG